MELQTFTALGLYGALIVLFFSFVIGAWQFSIAHRRANNPGEGVKCLPCFNAGMRNIQATQIRESAQDDSDIPCCDLCATYHDYLESQISNSLAESAGVYLAGR